MSPNSFLITELADLAGLPRPDLDLQVNGAGGLDEAGPGEVAFARAGTSIEKLSASRAGLLLVAPDAPELERPHLRHPNPRYLFCLALGLLRPAESYEPGIHASAVVDAEAELGPDVSVAALAVIEKGARIGARTRVGAHVVIESGARIGVDARLGPHAVVHGNAILGDRVHLHAGAVVGSEGFGFEPYEGRIHRMPHVGRVEIGDDVEIGVHAVVDRATTGLTSIGPDTKLDNLVQVGHNARIGAHDIIAALCGIAGSSEIGDGVIIGGKSATADHARVGSGARVGGQSGVYSRVDEGATVSGVPARDHREHLRQQAALRYLPELLRKLRDMDRRLGKLESEGGSDSTA